MTKTTRGTAGIDHLTGKAKADTILGLDGDDMLEGMGGDDTLNGGAGNDYAFGGSGNDKIYGDIGNDFLFGDGGNDTIKGGDGSDIIVGGEGDDTLQGDTGNDRMFSITGDDKMQGGVGDDYYEIGVGFVTALDISGNDEYVIVAGSNATIDDTGGVDKIRFKDLDSETTVTIDDLILERFGNDLVISVDGVDGGTTLTSFYEEDKSHRIERLFDENKDASAGYSLAIQAVLDLESGGSSIRGSDVWDL